MNSTLTGAVADLEAGRKALRWGLIAATAGPFFVAIGIFAASSDATAVFGSLGLGVLFLSAFLGVRALRGNDPRIVLDTPRGEQGAAAVRAQLDQLPPNVRHELVAIGQPVWWVSRGVIAGGGFFALFGAGAVAVAAAVAGAAVSIWIGRRTQRDRRLLWYVVPLNIVAAITVPAFLAAAYVTGGAFPSSNPAGSSRYNPPMRGLTLDGTSVSNIYPFDAQGRQVSVRLYDQDGNPIALRRQDCAATFGSGGPASTNLFPLAVVSPDGTGNVNEETCKDSERAPFVPPPAPATPTTTPTPRPSVTLTVSPTR